MFENETYLHRIAKSMSFMPELMREAVKEKDKIKQLQQVISMFLVNTNNQLANKQPMNPILGETHSCMIGDCQGYFEQISHHPPISAYYFDGPGYILHGQLHVKLGFGLPNLYIYFNGDNTVIFKETGHVYKFSPPYIRLKDFVSGPRRIIVEGPGFIWSPNLNYFVPFTFSPGGGGMKRWVGKPKDRDEIEGTAYEVHPDVIAKFIATKQPRDHPKLKDGKNQTKALFEIEGKWTGKMKIGNM